MSCNGSNFDAQETEYALAATRTLMTNEATARLTDIAGATSSPQNKGFRFWNISPDAGQGMAYLSSPDAYCTWAVEVAWRNHTQTLYYRTGPANGVYVPVYYGATVYCQLVQIPADSVRQWNGVPIASSDVAPEAKGMFFKGMMQEPAFAFTQIVQAQVPSDTVTDLTSSLSGTLYPIGNAASLTVTAVGAGTLTFAGGPEWDRGIENNWRSVNEAVSCAGWSSFQWAYYSTTAANAILTYSNRPLGT